MPLLIHVTQVMGPYFTWFMHTQRRILVLGFRATLMFLSTSHVNYCTLTYFFLLKHNIIYKQIQHNLKQTFKFNKLGGTSFVYKVLPLLDGILYITLPVPVSNNIHNNPNMYIYRMCVLSSVSVNNVYCELEKESSGQIARFGVSHTASAISINLILISLAHSRSALRGWEETHGQLWLDSELLMAAPHTHTHT